MKSSISTTVTIKLFEKSDTETIVYKGYSIRLKKESHCALISKNGKLVKCIAGNILKNGSNNRLSKAMNFCYKNN